MWEIICNGINKSIDFITTVLPTSPFQYYIRQAEKLPYLGYLNYFVPIPTFIAIGQSWLTCIVIYYLYSVIMRWVKIVGE